MDPTIVLALLKRFWKPALGLVLCIALYIWADVHFTHAQKARDAAQIEAQKSTIKDQRDALKVKDDAITTIRKQLDSNAATEKKAQEDAQKAVDAANKEHAKVVVLRAEVIKAYNKSLTDPKYNQIHSPYCKYPDAQPY